MFDFRKGERFLKRLRKERKIFQKYWKLKIKSSKYHTKKSTDGHSKNVERKTLKVNNDIINWEKNIKDIKKLKKEKFKQMKKHETERERGQWVEGILTW